jgi:hypothetical protein
MQYQSVNQVTKKIQRYWYEDGIWEIGFGLVNAIIGAFFLVTAPFDWSGSNGLVLLVLQFVFIVGPFLVINRAVRFLKERITYPRTGYVAYRRQATSRRLKRFVMGGLVGAAVAAMVGIIAVFQAVQNLIPVIIGLVMAAMLAYLGHRFSLMRLYIVAVGTALWGVVVAWLSLADPYSTGVFFCGYGSLIVLSGAVTLLAYLRNTRPAGQDMQDPFAEPENQQLE